MVEFGFPMGPFADDDLAGLDIGWRMRQRRRRRRAGRRCPLRAGRFGQKTGEGFYRYEAGSRTPIARSRCRALIVDASQRLGIAAPSFTSDEIVERLLFPMINEGARILEEGIALRPGDIDVIWVYGYGLPAWRGGPMFYADQFGLAEIRDRLSVSAERSGDPPRACCSSDLACGCRPGLRLLRRPARPLDATSANRGGRG